MQDIITEEQLLNLGFTYAGEGPDVQPFEKVEDFKFKYWELQLDEFKLEVTTETNLAGEPLLQYVELNDIQLSKPHLSLQELIQLKNLL